MLIQSEKLSASSRMAAIVAYELNNPLAAVQNLIYSARQSSVGNPEATPTLKAGAPTRTRPCEAKATATKKR